ncbi:MAG: M56 family metallopeptidase [Actinomycetales bacterium]|nr:M56 family metallopeptidase [Actinomycetales bacterium]
MNLPPLLMPLAVEWVILVTTLVPLVGRGGRGRANNHPTIVIFVLFSALASAIAGAAIALLIACQSVLALWRELSNSPASHRSAEKTLIALGASFAPWILLALAGITIALVNQRLEPHLLSARALTPRIESLFTTRGRFHGVEFLAVESPAHISFTTRIHGRNAIVLSTHTLATLTQKQLDAVLWHELGHIRLGHYWLKFAAKTLAALTPRIVASRVLVERLEELAEVAADNFAARRVGHTLLAETRALLV